jgi:hypothetical protein
MKNKLRVLSLVYWSLDEVILEQYWRVLFSGCKGVSNNYYFFNMFSRRWEKGKCNSASVEHL